MNEQDRQKMKEFMKKMNEMNRSLLEELDHLLDENKRLEEENQSWREHYEAATRIYKRNQPNQPVRQLNREQASYRSNVAAEKRE